MPNLYEPPTEAFIHEEYYDDLLDAEARPNDTYHIVPTADTYPHRSSSHCWCHPKQDTDECGEPIWVHNAHDGRASYEEL